MGHLGNPGPHKHDERSRGNLRQVLRPKPVCGLPLLVISLVEPFDYKAGCLRTVFVFERSCRASHAADEYGLRYRPNGRTGARSHRAERVAAASDRRNLIWVMPAQGVLHGLAPPIFAVAST